MIVVCECGQHLRIRDLTKVAQIRCPTCKTMANDEAHRQAERNANIVLEIAAALFTKTEWTDEEVRISRILAAHDLVGRK